MVGLYFVGGLGQNIVGGLLLVLTLLVFLRKGLALYVLGFAERTRVDHTHFTA